MSRGTNGGAMTMARAPLVVAVATAALIAVALPALAGSAKTQLISKNSAGEAADGTSQDPSISASGRFVAFQSEADNLPGEDFYAEVYVRDRRTGETKVVSKTSSGELANSHSELGTLGGAISASGRHLVFHTTSTNLPGDHTGFIDNAYVRDRKTGKTKLMSKTSAGDPAIGGASSFATISASGRYVAFQSQATNLPGDHTYPNVYRRDRETGKTRLASKTSGGNPATGGQSVGALVSPSGRYVCFESNATNLGGDDSETDVFCRDFKTGKTKLISRNSAGDPATGNDSYGGWTSASGRFVAFESGATNLPGDHTGLQFNAYVRDRKTGKTKLISKTSGGQPATGGGSGFATISASGRFVAFRSDATNLPGDDTVRDVYLRDRRTGRTKLLSKNSAGQRATGGDSDQPVIAALANYVAFVSEATNLPGNHPSKNVYLRGPLR